MTIIPDSPAGSSPLVEQIGSDVTQINIVPGFGDLLQVVFHGSSGMPEAMPGAVSAVTVYGDGRIEYHLAQAAAPKAKCAACMAHGECLGAPCVNAEVTS